MITWIPVFIVVPIFLLLAGCSLADLVTGKPYVFINVREKHNRKKRHANPVPDYAHPIEAFKYAQLVWDVTEEKLRLTGIGHGADFPYDAKEATFTCKLYEHDYPRINHSCGFYALKKHVYDNINVIPAEVQNFIDYVGLDIEMWGWIQEHKWGYRAQHQRVLAMHLKSTCGHAGPQNIFVFKDTHIAKIGMEATAIYCESCSKEHDDGYNASQIIPLGVAANQMGIEVQSDLSLGFIQNRFLIENEVK